jgi:RNA polymerase sigma factor (sigma-70 family)
VIAETRKLSMVRDAGVCQVIEEYGPALHRFLKRALTNPADAEDLAQETFSAFARSTAPGKFKNPRGYLYGIARNVLRGFWRRAGRSPKTVTNCEVDPNVLSYPIDAASLPSNDPADELAALAEFDRAFRRLPTTHKLAMCLTHEQGFSNSEAARRLEVTPETIKKYKSESLAQISKALLAKE